MAKLRHIALAVKDLQKSAKFYEQSFGFTRVRESDVAIGMTDGLMSLVLLYLPRTKSSVDERGEDFIDLHHIGFQVDDLDESSTLIETAGGTWHGQIDEAAEPSDRERKYRDPNGIVFDVATADHARDAWRLPKPGE